MLDQLPVPYPATDNSTKTPSLTPGGGNLRRGTTFQNAEAGTVHPDLPEGKASKAGWTSVKNPSCVKLRRIWPLLWGILGLTIGGLVLWVLSPPEWRRLAPVEDVLTPELMRASAFPPADALACKGCHEAEFEDWSSSQHAHANRLVSFDRDRPAFIPSRTFREGLLTTEVFARWNDFLVRQKGPDGQTSIHPAVAVIGVEPLTQYLAPFPGGRLQVINPAYDPAKKDWFDIYQGEQRQIHEWGFWKNQGMNWNSQCAYCHMTSYEKNYNVVTDSYASTWKAMGISCTQCHGPMEGHAANPQAPARWNPAQIMSSCAACHSRREELTGRFHPGEDFHDHFRLELPNLTDTYHPDGQVRDENFEYASFLGSKMGRAGVTCLDCHQAHSGKLKLPVENNALCMSCHTPPGLKGATPIPDPTAHSHHAPGSRGNLCVECHMPRTTYMARDPRRDHGFTIPDPLLTKELGIPNACNRCHADQATDWAVDWSQKWYGPKLDRPSRERARLVARARTGDPDVTSPVIDFFRGETNSAWRASLVALLQGRERSPGVADFLADAAREESPLVRTAALRVLDSARPDLLIAALDDSSRSVRLTAAWSLLMAGQTLPPAKRKEIQDYLDNLDETPAGAFNQARLAAIENRAPEMDRWVERAIAGDPSAGAFQQSAMLMAQVGRSADARKFFERSLAEEPDNAETTYSLALLEAEFGNTPRATELLRKTVQIAPRFGRAWYNLGLAEASADNLPAAAAALTQAGELLPDNPDPPYALATIFLRMKEPAKALEAVQRALGINPNHPEARRLLQSLFAPPHSERP